jgi:hypothetical protein
MTNIPVLKAKPTGTIRLEGSMVMQIVLSDEVAPHFSKVVERFNAGDDDVITLTKRRLRTGLSDLSGHGTLGSQI